MDPATLAHLLEEFLAEFRNAVVLEDGATLFDFLSARYSLSGNDGKCVLHLWSDERNVVRRVVACERNRDALKLQVQRFGQSKPAKMEIVADRDRRTPSARKAARDAYGRLLRRVLERHYPGWTVDRLTGERDLERSFGPVYTRGVVKQGTSAFAVMGVNAQESQASIDAMLTFGILWLDLCRERYAPHCYVQALKLFVPPRSSDILRERMAHLDHGAAKWQLYELDEREVAVVEIDTADRGNIETRLVQCPEMESVHARFAKSIARVMEVVPEAEVAVLSTAEIAFRLYGLEFARARMAPEPASFRMVERLTFGTGSHETELTDDNAGDFVDLLSRLRELRRADGPHVHALWRMTPERWLESLVVRNVAAVDERLDPAFVYSQVPAFTAADRAMIDVLTCTRDGRLAVLELKADEDIQLPLQGLDYWARVQWHHARGEFRRFGYFAGKELLPEPPILLLVAPALRVHPTTDTLLRYIAPEIDCTLIAVGEQWREELKVIFRKRRTRAAAALRLP
jgi:hypothetical protein